jgi:hypothetical protein
MEETVNYWWKQEDDEKKVGEGRDILVKRWLNGL